MSNLLHAHPCNLERPLISGPGTAITYTIPPGASPRTKSYIETWPQVDLQELPYSVSGRQETLLSRTTHFTGLPRLSSLDEPMSPIPATVQSFIDHSPSPILLPPHCGCPPLVSLDVISKDNVLKSTLHADGDHTHKQSTQGKPRRRGPGNAPGEGVPGNKSFKASDLTELARLTVAHKAFFAPHGQKAETWKKIAGGLANHIQGRLTYSDTKPVADKAKVLVQFKKVIYESFRCRFCLPLL